MQWLMPLWTQRILFLITELLLFMKLPLLSSDGEVIAASEENKLLTRIHDILESVVSKQVGNTTHILAYPFNYASRHCHEVWASQFPFFTLLMILYH